MFLQKITKIQKKLQKYKKKKKKQKKKKKKKKIVTHLLTLSFSLRGGVPVSGKCILVNCLCKTI